VPARVAAVGVSSGMQSPKRMSEMPESVFNQLISVLATDAGSDWKGCDGIGGIVWREPAPLKCLDVAQLHRGYSRTATFALTGFGEVALPDFGGDGRSGFRLGNEGECSLSMNGDSETVHEVVIVKYYPCSEVGSVLCRQLPETVNLEPIDLNGWVGDDQADALYKICFSDGGTVFAAIICDEGGRSGPGFTTFVLTRNDPRQRINEMRCREE
jgi:hypothetical protein